MLGGRAAGREVGDVGEPHVAVVAVVFEEDEEEGSVVVLDRALFVVVVNAFAGFVLEGKEEGAAAVGLTELREDLFGTGDAGLQACVQERKVGQAADFD